MKILLKITGLILILAGISGLLLAVLCLYAAMHTLDGTDTLRRRQYFLAVCFFAAGLLILTLGILCVRLSRKR